jgi:hypothetical protein
MGVGGILFCFFSPAAPPFPVLFFFFFFFFAKDSFVATSTFRSWHPMFPLLAAEPQVLLVMAECVMTFEMEILDYNHLTLSFPCPPFLL